MIRHPLNWAVCHGCRLHSNYLQHGCLENCILIGQSPTFSHVYCSVWFVHLSHRAASHQGDTFQQKKILESVSCISFLAPLSIWRTAAPGTNMKITTLHWLQAAVEGWSSQVWRQSFNWFWKVIQSYSAQSMTCNFPFYLIIPSVITILQFHCLEVANMVIQAIFQTSPHNHLIKVEGTSVYFSNNHQTLHEFPSLGSVKYCNLFYLFYPLT